MSVFQYALRTVLVPTQPRIEWVGRPVSLEVKRPDREADHSPHTITILRKSKTGHSHYTILSWRDKTQENFILTKIVFFNGRET
jgi:hypothetical protein